MSVRRYVRDVLMPRAGRVIAFTSDSRAIVDVGGSTITAPVYSGFAPAVGDEVTVVNLGNTPMVFPKAKQEQQQQTSRKRRTSLAVQENKRGVFSTRISVAANSSYTVAHGLGRIPSRVTMWHEPTGGGELVKVCCEAAVGIDDVNISIVTGTYVVDNAIRQQATDGYYHIFAE